MKYYLMVIGTMILMSLVQKTAEAQQPEIGFKSGLNIYSLKFEHNAETGNKTGLQYGFYARFYPDWLQPFTLQPEFYYSPQGVKLKNENALITLDHINVPILFQYVFDNGIRVQAGPQLGFILNAKADYDVAVYDIKKRFKKADLGLSTGLSYLYAPFGVGIDIRYNLGISKISTDNFFRSKNRGLQVALFYEFRYGE
jgi:hypothetical protein